MVGGVTVASAALCAAAVVFWIRGHFFVDGVASFPAAIGPAPVEVKVWSVVSAMGEVRLERTRLTVPMLDPSNSAAWDKHRAKMPSGLRWYSTPVPRLAERSWGFLWTHDTGARLTSWSSAQVYADEWQFGLPWWLFAVATAILPFARCAVCLRRLRQRKPGCCRACGYDLRATPDRCPECGRGITSASPPPREEKGETEGV
jgi:hypothetical protein